MNSLVLRWDNGSVHTETPQTSTVGSVSQNPAGRCHETDGDSEVLLVSVLSECSRGSASLRDISKSLLCVESDLKSSREDL